MTEEQGWHIVAESFRSIVIILHQIESEIDRETDPNFTRLRELVSVFYGWNDYSAVINREPGA